MLWQVGERRREKFETVQYIYFLTWYNYNSVCVGVCVPEAE